jgi:hypothetical protein
MTTRARLWAWLTGLRRILILPPERGCPQPQHVRKGAGLLRVGQACVVGTAAAEDSRAPAASRSGTNRSSAAMSGKKQVEPSDLRSIKGTLTVHQGYQKGTAWDQHRANKPTTRHRHALRTLSPPRGRGKTSASVAPLISCGFGLTSSPTAQAAARRFGAGPLIK